MLMLDASGIAARAGVQAEVSDAVSAIKAEAVGADGPKLISTLLFKDVSGCRRGIRLSVVERLEDVEGDQVSFTGGRLRVAVDGRLVPLLGIQALPQADGAPLKLLRLSDGTGEVAYAIDDVIDIVQLAPELHPAMNEGPVAGVTLVEGEAVELLDLFWLFAQAETAPVQQRPLCLVAEPEDRWSREILQPLLEAAGYRVGFGAESREEEAAVIITSAGEAPSTKAPVIRLRSDLVGGEEGSVYRYDRVGLLAAIERQITRRRA